MAHKSFRKSQLVEFKNTAAGHQGVLSDPSGSLIVKPCKPSEITFYESCAAHQKFAEYIPNYMGTISLSSDTDPAEAAAAFIQSKEAQAQVHGLSGISEAIVVENAWTPSNGGKISTNCALVMENVADGYRKPNILDVKLGARLWAEDAPMAKRAKLDKVAAETTSKPLGFRVAGMRVWHGLESSDQEDINLDGYKVYDKDYGRKLNQQNVVEGFEDFLRVERGTRPLRSARKIIWRFIEDLEGMEAVLKNEESRMYSASLLFVYEGDAAALQEAFTTETQMLDLIEADARSYPSINGGPDGQNNLSDSNGASIPLTGNDASTSAHYETASTFTPINGVSPEQEISLPHIQLLKLIDFAHAEWTSGQGPDENLLHGIGNVIKTLKHLLDLDP